MQTTYVQPEISLDYRNGGLDRFGRIINHAWRDASGDALMQISHGYDLAGNRTNRQDGVNAEWSEAYGYDEMGQITSLQRSDLTESWQYDPTGNWIRYEKNNAVENRSHNSANEILSTVAHDSNGNMTTMPSPKTGTAMNCVYDVWNRLVAIGANIRYEYNGLNHRIAKTVDNVRTESFFNEKWQELESKRHEPGTVSPVLAEYVWGQRYIDDLIYREKSDEKLYSVADPNWNVVAVVDEDGAVQERFKYDAFGKLSGLTSDWDRTFTGQVLDNETGLMLYRNRFYHVALGRFVTRDPIGYGLPDEYCLYRITYNMPIRFLDPLGFVGFTDEQIRAFTRCVVYTFFLCWLLYPLNPDSCYRYAVVLCKDIYLPKPEEDKENPTTPTPENEEALNAEKDQCKGSEYECPYSKIPHVKKGWCKLEEAGDGVACIPKALKPPKTPYVVKKGVEMLGCNECNKDLGPVACGNCCEKISKTKQEKDICKYTCKE